MTNPGVVDKIDLSSLESMAKYRSVECPICGVPLNSSVSFGEPLGRLGSEREALSPVTTGLVGDWRCSDILATEDASSVPDGRRCLLPSRPSQTPRDSLPIRWKKPFVRSPFSL